MSFGAFKNIVRTLVMKLRNKSLFMNINFEIFLLFYSSTRNTNIQSFYENKAFLELSVLLSLRGQTLECMMTPHLFKLSILLEGSLSLYYESFETMGVRKWARDVQHPGAAG